LRHPGHVSMLFVQSSRQRGGIARGLLATAAALAGDTDCEFTVSSSPNAVSAYERLGFRITGPEQCVHGIRFVPMQRVAPMTATPGEVRIKKEEWSEWDERHRRQRPRGER
jgi:GNAT superfamily N-acetyltransferase